VCIGEGRGERRGGKPSKDCREESNYDEPKH
jgi:hypothetical protein